MGSVDGCCLVACDQVVNIGTLLVESLELRLRGLLKSITYSIWRDVMWIFIEGGASETSLKHLD